MTTRFARSLTLLLAPMVLACSSDDGSARGDSATPVTDADTDTDAPIGTTGPTAAQTDLHLNEVVSSNATGLEDESGAFPDWIEIYNAGPEAVNLGGYTLTDEEDWTDQWTFDDGVIIAAGGHIVVFADGDEEDGPLHTNFKLSSTGESVFLYGPEAQGALWLDVVEFPALVPDSAYAREGDGASTWVIDDSPTPEAPNE